MKATHTSPDSKVIRLLGDRYLVWYIPDEAGKGTLAVVSSPAWKQAKASFFASAKGDLDKMITASVYRLLDAGEDLQLSALHLDTHDQVCWIGHDDLGDWRAVTIRSDGALLWSTAETPDQAKRRLLKQLEPYLGSVW